MTRESFENVRSRRRGEEKAKKVSVSFRRRMLVASIAILSPILFLGGATATQDSDPGDPEDAEDHVSDSLQEMNSELLKLNSMMSHLSWKLSTEPDGGLATKVTELGAFQMEWRQKWCSRLNDIFAGMYAEGEFRNRPKKLREQFRQFYLLCRGPVYDKEQNRMLVEILGKLEAIYETSQVCLGNDTCFRGEPDLERIVTKSRSPEVLLWAWKEWRNKVGPPSRALYPALVSILNQGARNNGYNEIGECWREELEAKNLEELVENLYRQIEPLYVALHAVVRFRLRQYYGEKLISPKEPIPAHLLGNIWAQNWGSLLDIMTDVKKEESLTYYLNKKNYTLLDLVRKAEDFFVSLGFKPMTEAFWKHSKLGKEASNGSTCHGTAANMFRPNDFRIILCAEITEEDFSVIHHEMGHVVYYMQYQDQPAVFQEGANSAFQEAIGDAVMYGVMSPFHLHRLGMLESNYLNAGDDIKFLLRQALTKLPQIPFALALEKWRWNVFRGGIAPEEYNEEWWRLKERYQGIRAPVPRTESDFDPSAKFHINDNKPYIRYFLSSILQLQIFESLCKAAIFGEFYANQTIPFQLHKCDIYGSKTATKNLRKMMSKGCSISWKEALNMITGEDSYSVRPLLDYYRPLYEWLLREIQENDIPVGWDSVRYSFL